MVDPVPTQLSRRLLLGSGAALGVGFGLRGVDAAAAPTDRPAQHLHGSTREAVSFLQSVLDGYRTTGFRLAQSYQDASGLSDIAFVYDNALAIVALLTAGDTARARSIGDALLYAQDHDPDFNDGRLRQAYHADGFVWPDGKVHFGYEFGLVGTAVGDLAWAGIALAHLARRTRRAKYRAGVTRIAQWIFNHAYSTSGLGGYTFGERAGLEDHKSTEHNIDVYAFFRMVARLTGDPVWRDRADHAWAFVERMWNADAGFFWTGSDDGSTINQKPSQLPLDVQTWSWLAARRRRYAAALDWAAANLATTDTPLRANSSLTGNYSVTGVAFSSGSVAADTDTPIDPWHGNPDSGAVWFEGCSQLALALRDRDGRSPEVDALLGAVRSAQQELGRGQVFAGRRVEGGVVAASSPMDTGFGFGYYPDLHVGATAWYVLAATRTNPYRLP